MNSNRDTLHFKHRNTTAMREQRYELVVQTEEAEQEYMNPCGVECFDNVMKWHSI